MSLETKQYDEGVDLAIMSKNLLEIHATDVEKARTAIKEVLKAM